MPPMFSLMRRLLPLPCVLFLACSDSGGTGSADAGAPPSGDADGLEEVGAADETTQGDASDTGEPVNCPPSQCVETGTQSCTGGLGYHVCAPDLSGCVDLGEFIPCQDGRTCAAGTCFGGCVVPEIVFVVDQSVAMKGTRYAELYQGLRRVFERTAAGVWYGLVFTGESACDIGGTHVLAKGEPDDLIDALQTAGTGDATELALSTALDSAAALLGNRGEGERIVLLTANESPCGGADGAVAAAARLRERDARLRVLWLGDADGSPFADALAAAGGTEDARVTLDGESVSQAVLDLLSDLDTCCIDPDGDTRGQFCQGGLDCDETNNLVSSSNCVGKSCGDDGCGGSCGVCTQVVGGTTACKDFQCVTTCEAGHHACDPACVPDDAVTSCGDRCDACPAPSGGSAACTPATAGGYECSAVCEAGHHVCGDKCVTDDSPLHCGAGCDPCPGAANAEPACVEGSCALQCNEAHLLCDGACVACPTVGVATTTCADGACVAASCDAGFVPCSPDSGEVATACCDRVIEVLDEAAELAAYPSVGVLWPDQVLAAWHHETAAVGEARVSRGKAGFATVETLSSSASPANGRFTRVSLDALDTPRVAWRGGETPSAATIVIATQKAGTWSSLSVADTFSPVAYQAGDFAFAAGTAEQYAVYTSVDELGYATSNGLSATQAVFADEASTDYNDAPAALLGSDGKLHVLVVEDDNTVALISGLAGVTTRVQVDTIANVGTHRFDLAEKSDGTLGFCWLDNTVAGDRGLLFAEDGDFAKMPVDKEAEESCELAYSKTDQAFLAYRSIKGEIRLAYGPGDGLWTVETVQAPSAKGLGLRWPALGIHPNDAVSVVFWDGDAGDVIHVFFPSDTP